MNAKLRRLIKTYKNPEELDSIAEDLDTVDVLELVNFYTAVLVDRLEESGAPDDVIEAADEALDETFGIFEYFEDRGELEKDIEIDELDEDE